MQVFRPADILIPKTDMQAWSVVACDQFTSEPEYWEKVYETVGDKPSALRLILPEAELGVKDPEAESARYTEVLKKFPTDIVVMGIGENGHIAFNDPPVADFNDPKWVKPVKLDDVCRQQQVNDGCFAKFDDVPAYAMTLTCPTLMRATGPAAAGRFTATATPIVTTDAPVWSASARRGRRSSRLPTRPRLCIRRSWTCAVSSHGKNESGSALTRRRMTASAPSTAAAGTRVLHISAPPKVY